MTTQNVQKRDTHLNIFAKNQGRAAALPCPTGSFALTETPVCPQEHLVIIIIIVFYLLILYLSALPNTPKNPFASIYTESLIKTACQHLWLLVGFDNLIYRKYYDTPPILVGHQ
jgi:hypothetical protein